MRDQAFANERLWQEFEQSIRELNQRYIRAATGGVRKEHLLRAAENVARLRARYLSAVLKLEAAAETPPTPELDKVRQLRLAFEEALQGFEALRHAHERGYFDLG
jgi:hypothetical protein